MNQGDVENQDHKTADNNEGPKEDAKQNKEEEVNTKPAELKVAGEKENLRELTPDQKDLLISLMGKISEGADSFLFKEYFYLFFFIIFFGTLVFLYAEPIAFIPFTAIAFVTGASSSILSGYIGMKIATKANARTCYKAL